MTSLCKNKLPKEAVSDEALDSVFERLDMLLEEPTDTKQIDDPEIIAIINKQVEAFDKIATNLNMRINKFQHLILMQNFQRHSRIYLTVQIKNLKNLFQLRLVLMNLDMTS